jgi:ubiquinone/menaquinone biosynthesis C-methylase UbiE
MGVGLTPREAMEFYDRWGAKQDLQAFYENPAVEDLIAHAAFGEAQAVFEFGCGTGRLAEELLAHRLPAGSRYLGMDVSSTMVELARRRLLPWGGRAQVQLSDGSTRLPLPAGLFDRFVSTYVLDLLGPEDTQSLLAEAHRILSGEGRLCLVSLTYGSTLLGRVVSWGWERIYKLRPRLVGGCRPVRLSDYLGLGGWEIDYANVVTSFGISSEILIARSIGV